MNRSPKFSVLLILSLLWFLLGNCYFNPLVNGLLDPKVEETDSSALLGLAGGGQAVTVSITGQIKRLGTPLVSTDVSILNPSFSPKDTTTSSTTNSAGRFYLNIQTGLATLQFKDVSTTVTILLEVSPTSATVRSIDNPNYELQNLETYMFGGDPPVYLELITSTPYDGYIANNNADPPTYIPSTFSFAFSENIDIPSDLTAWRNQNFEITGGITFKGLPNPILPNLIQIDMDVATYSNQTNYVLTLKPGIRSISGKSIKTTTINFRIESFLPP